MAYKFFVRLNDGDSLVVGQIVLNENFELFKRLFNDAVKASFKIMSSVRCRNNNSYIRFVRYIGHTSTLDQTAWQNE